MNKLLRFLALPVLALGLLATSRAETETYKIDAAHSSVGFSLRHILSKFTSSFTKLDGTITVDHANLEKSNVEATINVAALNTDNEGRDKQGKNDGGAKERHSVRYGTTSVGAKATC